MADCARSNFHVSPLADQWRNFILFYKEKPASLSRRRRRQFINVEWARVVRGNQRRRYKTTATTAGTRKAPPSDVGQTWIIDGPAPVRPGATDERNCALVFVAEALTIVDVNHIEDSVWNEVRRHKRQKRNPLQPIVCSLADQKKPMDTKSPLVFFGRLDG